MSWTRLTAMLFAATLLWVGPVNAQNDLEAVKVDAAHHKVEFENDQVRVGGPFKRSLLEWEICRRFLAAYYG